MTSSKKHITKKYVIIAAILSFAGIGFFSLQYIRDHVKDTLGSSTVIVYLGVTPPPPDLCPNIYGVQNPIPNGMQLDINGNCYTPVTPPPDPAPTPTPSPAPLDVCANITGNQSVIPSGYYRTASNACYPQTVPPVDVCPKIAGTQSTVPDGYINGSDGDCYVAPPDLCPNIEGSQYAIPAGMKLDANKNCYTPVINQPTAPTTPNNPPYYSPIDDADGSNIFGTGALENVPKILGDILQPLVNLFPKDIRLALHSVPREISASFPYFTFTAVLGSAIVMFWQGVREIYASRKLNLLLAKERSVAEQKDNFLMLASHYLLTPLTLVNNGIDTIITNNELPKNVLTPLYGAVSELKLKINGLIEDLTNNTALKSVDSPSVEPSEKRHYLLSRHFLIPVILSGTLTLLGNFLFGVVGDVKLGTTNLWAQTIIYGCLGFSLYAAIRTADLRHKQRLHKEKLVEYESAIDTARTDFIDKATKTLGASLHEVNKHRSIAANTESVVYINEGYNRFLEILNKFTLLTQVRTGAALHTETFRIAKVTEEILGAYKEQINEKSIQIINNIADITIKQNPNLFRFVLGSVIDNAVKFTGKGGTVTLSSNLSEGNIDIHIDDTGIGVDPSKLPQLFQPFSRAESAAQFDYEGLGFSLFLDKIIMDSAGGYIAADSVLHEGTRIIVSSRVPVNAS